MAPHACPPLDSYHVVGNRAGVYSRNSEGWSRPDGLAAPETLLRDLSVAQGTEDFVVTPIQEFDPEPYAAQDTITCEVLMPDYSQLVAWTEEADKVATLTRRDKKQLLQALGAADEVHGESFPAASRLLAPVPENGTLQESIKQVGGDDQEDMEEDANLEADEDNNDHDLVDRCD